MKTLVEATGRNRTQEFSQKDPQVKINSYTLKEISFNFVLEIQFKTFTSALCEAWLVLAHLKSIYLLEQISGGEEIKFRIDINK